MRKMYGLMTVLFLLFAQFVFAQTEVSGTVTDEKGNPLSSATISVKGTQTRTQSDANGVFKIKVPNDKAILIVSFVGYVAKNVAVTGSDLTIKLEEDNTKLNEVVVTGLTSSIKKANSANSIATINANQLTGKTRAQTLDGAMQGKVPGANIIANGGAPGGGFSVRLRGVSSITQDSEPLYIIDGVIVNNSQFNTGAGTGPFSGATRQTSGTQDQAANRIADINPQDIEKMEILKGPSAAAIYGTRANAGVIIITTKKGKNGKTSISFSQDFGIAQAQRFVEMHTTKWDKQFTAGVELATGAQLTALKTATNPTDQTWDYERIIYGNTGFLTNSRLSLTGGTDKVRFYVGAGLQNEKGIQKGTGYNRTSLRLNLDLKPFSFMDISINSSYVYTNSDRSFSGNDNNGVSIGYNMAYLPNWLPQLPVNGVYPDNPFTGQNILEIVDKGVNNEKVNRLIQSFSSNIYLLQKENQSLKLTFQGGVDWLQTYNEVYMPDDVQYQQAKASGNPPGASRYTNIRNTNYNVQAALNHSLNVKDFTFNTSLGIVQLERNTRSEWIQGEGFKPGQRNPANASVILTSWVYSGEKEIGRFIQEDINYNDKVNLTLALRQDKSTLNGDPNKWYNFLKAGLSVNLTNFNFFKIKGMDLFKVRAAFGQTGKSAAYGNTFTLLNDVIIGGQSGVTYPAVIGNAGIEPETAQEIEAGFDMGLFNGRLGLEFTWYDKRIKNLIDAYSLSPGTGINSIAAFPIGEMQNTGIEIGLNGTIVKKKDLQVNAFVNWWTNSTKMLDLIIPEKAVGATGFGAFGTQRLRKGASPTAWYGSPNVGGLPTQYEDAQPLWQASMGSTITYKGFEFSFLLQHSHKNFNSSLNQELTDEGGTSPDWSTIDKTTNVPVGNARKLGQPGITTRQFIVEATYTKLREVSLYYNLPKTSVTSWFKGAVESIKVGVSANNLFLWTPYYGYDPEASNFGNRPTGATVDLLAYPSQKRMFFHLLVNF
jgi:TonB-linked SusC/RagA family outer membrane protein